MNIITDKQTKPIVLIIDDSDSIQKYVRALLEEAGFRTFSATDGRAGLDRIESHNPDVVLLDIEMPVMNGLEVLDALGRGDRLYSVVLFTHLSDSKNRISGLDKGADDYITKPIEPEELIARVKAASRTSELKKQLVSARHVAEEALIKYRNAQKNLINEHKLTAIAKLASGMAHEINNPLGFIKSNLGTIDKYARILSEGANRFVELSNTFAWENSSSDNTIKDTLLWMKKAKLDFICKDINPMVSETVEGVDRISSILKYLLIMDQATAYSKVESLDINSIVNACVMDFKSKLGPEIIFNTEFSATPLIVTACSEQLGIINSNIILNSVDAVGETGTITVKTRLEEECACIEIRDTGSGFPREVLPLIFDPFFTTKESYNNIGLGLTLSQYFIHAHGGQVEVESAEGEGTRVIIRIPQ